jgi:hypothetical protein
LRPKWSRTSERLAVLYPGQRTQVELTSGKDVLLSGEWTLQVSLGGHRIEPKTPWEQVCWVSDDDIDYLELEIELEEDVRVQRQIALAREDQILLLADAVLGRNPGRIEYRGCLPLCPSVEFLPAGESREGWLMGSKRRALVLPLSLPEWREQAAPGELRSSPDGLELACAAQASRLYAPLFVDLDRRRFTRPFTWRRLTVAEALDVQPEDVAAGYRVAVGKDQWLIYRTLADRANRTLLGHNLSTEALLARFGRKGKIEPLIEIE